MSMNALSLINASIPTLNPHTVVQEAQTTLLSYHIYEVPVVDKDKFLGFFWGSPFRSLPDPSSVVGDHIYNQDCFVGVHAYYYEIVKRSLQFEAHSVGVCNPNGVYAGTISTGDLVRAFGRLSATQSPGSVLVIRLRDQDYDLAQIIRLIEESDTKVLSLHVLQDPEKDHHIQLHIKIHTRDQTRSIATLKRFGYSVLDAYAKDASQDTKRNYDLLMRYLSS